MDGLDPPAELELFNSSCRGHCFKRQNYLNDLQSSTKRSKGGMEEPEEFKSKGLQWLSAHLSVIYDDE